jgi:hypothetical protein
MTWRENEACKKSYIVGIYMKLGLFEKVEYGLGSDLEVLAGFLEVRHWLPERIKGPKPMELLVETVNYGPVENVHPLKHFFSYLRVRFLHIINTILSPFTQTL